MNKNMTYLALIATFALASLAQATYDFEDVAYYQDVLETAKEAQESANEAAAPVVEERLVEPSTHNWFFDGTKSTINSTSNPQKALDNAFDKLCEALGEVHRLIQTQQPNNDKAMESLQVIHLACAQLATEI